MPYQMVLQKALNFFELFNTTKQISTRQFQTSLDLLYKNNIPSLIMLMCMQT